MYFKRRTMQVVRSLPLAVANRMPAASCWLTTHCGCCFTAVVSPARGPNSTTNGSYVLTTELQGPYALLPAGATNTSNVAAPDAVLQPNCSLMTYTTPGNTLVYATPLGDPAPVGPCRWVRQMSDS